MPADDQGNPKIGDFGLALLEHGCTLGITTMSDFQASLRWVSPELNLSGVRTRESDVWAFGDTFSLKQHKSARPM